MRIFSPMPTGSGAYIVHKSLEENINGFHLYGYNPLITLFPPLLYLYTNYKNAEIIHTSPDYAIYTRLKKAKLVITFHSYMLDEELYSQVSMLKRMHYRTDLRWNIKRALKTAAAVTAVSQYTAKLVKEDMNYKKEVNVIYNGIDVEKFIPKKRNNGRIKVLFAGNLKQNKGIKLLPIIAKELEKTNIDIYFTSGLRNKSHIKQTDNLISLGRIKHDDMPSLYQNMDILLFPTLREGFGLVVAEAMACGLPVVSTNCSSIPELIDDGKGGYLCAINDHSNMAEKLNILASSPDLRNTMGLYNREKAENVFSLKTMIRKYEELYSSLI